MGKPKTEWLDEYSGKPNTSKRYERSFNSFLKWAKTTDEEIVKELDSLKPHEFARKWGKIVVKYYNFLVGEKKLSQNTARTKTIAIRSFMKSQCIPLKIRHNAIAQPQMAMNEHEFTLEELQRMYQIGNLTDKVRLATGLSLGWGSDLFVNLKWSTIEDKLNGKCPVAFNYTRKKTGQPIRSHLTHESVNALKQKRKLNPNDVYVFQASNGKEPKPLSVQALNQWLQALARKAGIKTFEKIHFHLLRKQLFSALVNSGMSEINSKICIGKSSGASIETYVYPKLKEGFMRAHKLFTLDGITNGDVSEIQALKQENEEMKGVMRILAKFVVKEQKKPRGYEMVTGIESVIEKDEMKKLKAFLKKDTLLPKET